MSEAARVTLGDLVLSEPPYAVMAGTDVGSPVPITTETSSLFLDGTLISGEQTGNREIVLEVFIDGDAGNRDALIRAADALATSVDQAFKPLTIEIGDSLPIVYEVYRGRSERSMSTREPEPWRAYTLTFPALPFARSENKDAPSAYAPETRVVISEADTSTPGVQLLHRPAQPSWGQRSETPAGTNNVWWAWDAPVGTANQSSLYETLAPGAGDVVAINGTGLVGSTINSEVRSAWWREWGSSTTMVRRGPDRSQISIVPSAAGEVQVRAGASIALNADSDFITAGWTVYLLKNRVVNSSTTRLFTSGFTARGPFRLQAGVQWLNGSTVVDTVWGTGGYYTDGTYPDTVWAAAKRPPGATHVRPALRWVGATTDKDLGILGLGVWPSKMTTARPYPTSDTGNANMPPRTKVPKKGYRGAGSYRFSRGYVYSQRSEPIDLSGQEYLSGYFFGSLQDWSSNATLSLTMLGQTPLVVRLWDAAGRWSSYRLGPSKTVPNSTWSMLGRSLAEPEFTSTLGAADLATVIAWDVAVTPTTRADYKASSDAILSYPAFYQWWVDDLAAGVNPSGPVSPRGNVFTLPILGSARSPAAVQITNDNPMTDLLVCTAPDGTMPLVPISTDRGPDPNNSASSYPTYGAQTSLYYANRATTTPDPNFLGTYSIVASVVPALAIANPRCIVRQYSASGAIIDQQILTGIQQPGNQYVVFENVGLPLRKAGPENVGMFLTFDFLPARAANVERTWADALILDVENSPMFLNGITTGAVRRVWIDEPKFGVGQGLVYIGNMSDRSDALVPAQAYPYGTPLLVRAPFSRLLVYSTVGAPDATLDYFPRWLVEPIEAS